VREVRRYCEEGENRVCQRGMRGVCEGKEGGREN
jgi:hypothetical protein